MLLITLRSSEFDAYLDVGEGDFRSFTSLKTDDDGGGGTDAQVEITLPRTGSYIIRANTLIARAKGAYTPSMERQQAAGCTGGFLVGAALTLPVLNTRPDGVSARLVFRLGTLESFTAEYP